MTKSKTPIRSGLIGLAAFSILVAEIAALVWVASEIGWWTLVLMLVTTSLGFYLMQREWRREWESLVKSLASGELPPGRMADATLVLLGGVLLVLPGFLSDFVGLVLLLPFTRPLVRSGLAWAVGRVADQRVDGPIIIEGEATVIAPVGITNASDETVLRGVVVDGQ